MGAYNKGDVIPEGTRVRVSPNTAPYSGKIGIVVSSEGRQVWASLKHATRMTWVKVPGRESPFGFYTNNLERIEDMSKSNLVGPKPEPVQEPEFVTPFRSDGANIIDANGKVVTRVQFGGYIQGSYRSELPVQHKYRLAELFAKAVNELYKEGVDAPAPW